MTVTGIEWRDPGAHEGRYAPKRPLRAHKPADSDDDIVEIHGQADEEAADGLDEFE
jgi:hypothetical protein